jgi:hypothetical protein
MNKKFEDCLRMLLDSNNISLGLVNEIIEKLEKTGCKWRDLGDIEANLARVHIAGSGSQTLVERVTNAFDATLEQFYITTNQSNKFSNPRELISKIFDIEKGYIVNLNDSQRTSVSIKSGIEVFIKPLTSGYANIFFRDIGIGISRKDMPKTILSLNESNKFRKKYLIGQYGQGGSTTCGFSEYTIIVSKENSSKLTSIAFTIIRFNDLHEDLNAKDGKYEYLVWDDNFPPFVDTNQIFFPAGTYVGHISHETTISSAFINYYNLFDQVLFDTPLPYTLYYDKWEPGSKRILSGLRRRLQEGSETQKWNEYIYKFPNDPEYGDLTIRWFLLKASKTVKGKFKKIKTGDVLYDTNHPILITYNGQVHGKLKKHILKEDCRFGYIYNSLIVQVECDSITPLGRKFLFTTTRDRITDKGENLIQNAIITILCQDEYLVEENENRESKIISSKIQKSMYKMRVKLVEMLKRVDPGKFATMIAGSSAEGIEKKKSSQGSYTVQSLIPLPTKNEPSYLKIVNKSDPIEIPIGGTCRLKLESDAPDGCLDKDCDIYLPAALNDKLKIHSVSNFRGGRSNCILEPKDILNLGDKINVNLELDHILGNKIYSNNRTLLVTKKPESKKDKKLSINAPEIIAVYEGDEFYEIEEWSEEDIAEVREGKTTTIYVNMSNRWLDATLKATRYAEGKKENLKSEYLLHIAFHAFLQHDNLKERSYEIQDEDLEYLKKKELDRVARTLITAITSPTAFENK